MKGERGFKFPLSLWKSKGMDQPELNCEQTYYKQQLAMTEVPMVVYDFVNEPKPRGRSAMHSAELGGMQDGRLRKRASDVRPKARREQRAESLPRSVSGEFDPSLNRPFTSSWRRGIQLESKEALCLLGLKKKIVRLYEEERALRGVIDDDELGSACVKRRSESLRSDDGKPPKRKRGRPPKNKADRPKATEPKPPAPKAKVRRSKSSEATTLLKDVPESHPLRRSRSSKRPLLMVETSDSEGEKEPIRAASMNDEELALQLHQDLNAPMLRKRRRSSGLLSPSNSEQ